MNSFINSLPSPSGKASNPTWTGEGFLVDGQHASILEYSENFMGWSDDLTLIHEGSIGSSHPIDVASREMAIRNLSSLNLSEESVVLEIGCSSGFLIKEIAKRFPSLVLIGADVVKVPLLRLAKECPSIPFLRFDLLKSPIPDCAVDVVIMLNVLEHIQYDELAIQKIYAMLKPGGAVILEVPAGPSLFGPYDEELGHFRRYTANQLGALLANAGFVIKVKSHLAFFAYPLFYATKIFNKYFSSKQKKLFINQAKNTSKSILLKKLLEIEGKYFSRCSLPFGIRVIISAYKPKS